MSRIDYITIIVFAVCVMASGAAFSSAGRSMKGFFAGGGNVPWWISGLSLFMGFFSAGTFVVWGSIAYSEGLVAVTIQLTMAVAGFLTGALIAPRWNSTGCLTVAEYITKRFGAGIQKIYTVLFLFVSLFTTGAFLYPIAKIIEVSAGISLSASILLLGAFSIIYVSIGGLRAVVVTDVLQFLILTAAIVIVIPMSFDKAGGVGGFFAQSPENFFNLVNDEYNWLFIFAFMLYNLFFLAGNWAYVQRYTSVRTPRDSRKVGILFGILYLVSPVLWMLPPMIYRVVNPELDGLHNEDAYLLMCREALPEGLLGLMLGGMVFATASSLNATLNISAGVFTNDIFKRLYPRASEKTLMRTARLSTVAFGVAAVGVALCIPFMGGIVNVVISVAALTGVPLYLPLIWSLFSSRLGGRQIVTVTITSLAVNGTLKFMAPLLGLGSLSRAEEMIIGVGIPALLLTAVSLANKYIWKRPGQPHTVKNGTVPESEPGDNSQSILVIGLGATISGVFIVVLSLLQDSGIRNVPLVTGSVLLATGIAAVMRARCKGKSGKLEFKRTEISERC